MEAIQSQEGSGNRSGIVAEADRREQWFRFGPWTFNVRRALQIAERPRRIGGLPVERWARLYGLSEGSVPIFDPYEIDESYAAGIDLSRPVLVATMKNKHDMPFPLLIDGLHRLYRAHTEHVPQLPAYVLTPAETLAIREDGLPDVVRFDEVPRG